MSKASVSKARGKSGAGEQVYAIGIGSNRPLGKMGPRAIVEAALDALAAPPLRLFAKSRIMMSRPLGPSARTYANAAVVVATEMSPLGLLDHLQGIERAFHRRRYRRWGARTLDLDLLLWSGGKVRHERLVVPHPSLSVRDFVLILLKDVAPGWRDPASGLTIAQLTARPRRPRGRAR